MSRHDVPEEMFFELKLSSAHGTRVLSKDVWPRTEGACTVSDEQLPVEAIPENQPMPNPHQDEPAVQEEELPQQTSAMSSMDISEHQHLDASPSSPVASVPSPSHVAEDAPCCPEIRAVSPGGAVPDAELDLQRVPGPTLALTEAEVIAEMLASHVDQDAAASDPGLPTDTAGSNLAEAEKVSQKAADVWHQDGADELKAASADPPTNGATTGLADTTTFDPSHASAFTERSVKDELSAHNELVPEQPQGPGTEPEIGKDSTGLCVDDGHGAEANPCSLAGCWGHCTGMCGACD